MSRRARGLQILKTLAGIGPVHPPQRLPGSDQAHPTADHGWHRVWKFRRKILQRGIDDASKPARSQTALSGRLVNGDDPPDFQRGGSPLLSVSFLGGIAENFELGLHQLQLTTVMVFLHLAIESHHLPGLEAVAQICGVEPDTVQAASALARRHLKNGHAAGPEPPPRAYFRDHPRPFSHPPPRNTPRV